MNNRVAVFAATLTSAITAHHVADYLSQTDHQACRKAAPGYNAVDDTPYAQTWIANQKHCLTYHATMAAAVGATFRILGIRIPPGRAAAALALSWGTHAVIDRRWPVKKIMEWTGSGAWYEADKEAAPKVDQTLHLAVLHLAALLVAASVPAE
ncbi:hypothetical protein [Microbispora sp. NPDC049125]|uniref:hypothetical protein n=1 Tax=Microbispora sp. NPDC049125 TaxID=3154929 RepID=UPI003467026E